MRRTTRGTVRGLVLAAAAVIAALPGDRARADDPAADALLDAPGPSALLTQRFATDAEELRQAYGLPCSGAWLDRQDAHLAAWQGAVSGRFDAKAAASERADAVLLRDHLRRRREEIVHERRRLAETLALAPFAADLVELESARRRLESPAARDAATRLDAAKRAVDAIRAQVEKGAGTSAGTPAADALAPTPVAALRAARDLDALRAMLRTWFQDRDGFEPDFGWWVRKPWNALDQALDGYAKLLREKVAGQTDAPDAPLVGDPIGAAALAEELAAERIPYTPAELLAIAEREFAWCESEARKAAADMGLGDDWKAALANVKSLHAAPGLQDEVVAAQAREAIEFVVSRDLVTVPELCRATWRLEMIPEDRQRTMPYAYYSGQAMGVAYPSEGMDHDRKLQAMRGNNVHFSRIVTPHELIPGHHLQRFAAERHRPHRALHRTPFLVEGWALYWEMRLWDLGWAKSPQDRIGMLFWRMHRCARILVTLRFHLGELTPQRMIDFLVERVGHEKDGATAEVRRYVGGGYGALYQAAYMLGGLQLRALHAETVGAGRMSERAFHDAVLRCNAVPVRFIRAELLGETYGAEGPAPWRFADR